MTGDKIDFPFQSDLSLNPLLDFWRNQITPNCSYMAQMFREFEQQIHQIPELVDTIDNPSVLEKHRNLLIPLMSVVFPASSWKTEISGALEPCQTTAFYASPLFKRLLTSDDGSLKGYSKEDQGNLKARRLLRAYLAILEKIYGIHRELDTSSIQVVPDPETGLDRFYRLIPDLQFVDVLTVGKPPDLSPEDRRVIVENITDLEVLARFIPDDKFKFQGFSSIRAVDVTESEVISTLQTDLIDQESIFSADGFGRVLERLRTLFGRPDLMAAIGAIQKDKALVIKDGLPSSANCMFTNSKHIPLAELEGSFWIKAMEQGTTLYIPDLKEYVDLYPTNKRALEHGVRSLVISPLFYQGSVIGFLDIVSPRPNDLEPLDTMLAQQIAPLFSVALKRGIDEMNKEAQAIIKEKCTAVHPVVEWRFRQAAFQHMDRMRTGKPSEMEPIVFKDVIPFFAQTDIRGSSMARNISIQADLINQLEWAKEVMHRAGDARDWPLLHEFKFRIDRRIQNLTGGMASDDESSAAHFLKNELEPTFAELVGLGPRVSQAIENYTAALDPKLGVVYRRRRAFEESVALLNERLSAYLEEQEVRAQAIVPHYFEKHQTDGLDYVIYVGASIMPDGKFSRFHIQNLRLWQLMVACGMAWHTEKLKPELKTPLDTCQLILASNTPLSVRFRYDEKRFDVDGAYDIRHEIIKSRLDKATVKGNGERLTQPGRLAVAYSQPDEGFEMRRHIEFLTSTGFTCDDLELVDIEDVSGVKGLKAMRVGINLEKEHHVQEAISALV
jgi:GAF domain-containing protein